MDEWSRRHFSAALGSALLTVPAVTLAAQPARLKLDKLDIFRRRAFELGIRGLVVATSNNVVLSAGKVSEVSRIASVRKSFVSALFGMAAADGRIKLESTLADLRIDDFQTLSATEKSATVRDLLKSRSGIYLPTAAETPAMKAARPSRGSHAPGTFWYYNNWDFNVLGEIYQRATGEDLFSAIEHRIVRPLNFLDFDPLRDLRWRYDPDHPRFPSYDMWMSARDMALFGQLFLKRGAWAGRQIVPAQWVRESTTPYSRTDRNGWGSGYGYMWWIASDKNGGNTEGLPVGAFTAYGNGGRSITVFPDHDLVIAMQPEEVVGQPQAPIYTDKSAYTTLLRILFS